MNKSEDLLPSVHLVFSPQLRTAELVSQGTNKARQENEEKEKE